MNKYVEFVSDEDFLECVRKVVEAYQSLDENVTPTSILKESKNTIDEFKTIFDVCVNQISFDEWLKFELTRQQDKTINNKIGEFHQELLGKVDGWVDLGIGDETKIDLKKEDNTVFIELKNKYNTMNSSSEKTCHEKLENVIEKYPDATAYWAYVISKNYKSEDRTWKYQQREDERIRRISGDRLYTMVTGDSKALEKTFNAIPKAIVEILGEEYKLTEEDEEYTYFYDTYYLLDLSSIDTSKLSKVDDYYTVSSDYLDDAGLIFTGYLEEYLSIKIYTEDNKLSKIILESIDSEDIKTKYENKIRIQ